MYVGYHLLTYNKRIYYTPIERQKRKKNKIEIINNYHNCLIVLRNNRKKNKILIILKRINSQMVKMSICFVLSLSIPRSPIEMRNSKQKLPHFSYFGSLAIVVSCELPAICYGDWLGG